MLEEISYLPSVQQWPAEGVPIWGIVQWVLWDKNKKLQRDSNGRIFVDVNPVCFQAIVSYPNEVENVRGESSQPPKCGWDGGPQLKDLYYGNPPPYFPLSKIRMG